MPSFEGPLVGFAVGVLLAWLARVEVGHGGGGGGGDEAGERARALVVALFGGIVFAPACAYFLLFARDWSFAYLIDGRAVPSAVDLLLVLVDAAAPPLGFLAGRWASQRRAHRTFAALGGVPAALALALLVPLLGRLRIEGTYHQVRSDFGTQPVAGGPLGYAILWMGAAVVAGIVISARSLWRTRRGPEPADSANPPEARRLLGRRGRP